MRHEAIAGMTIGQHLLLKNIDYEMIDIDLISQRKDTVHKLMQDSSKYLDYRDARRHSKPLDKYSDIEHELNKIDKYHDDFFVQGAIFEEYVYHLIKDLHFDDVSLGTQVCYLPEEDGSFKNEIDILLMKENHMHIIECKFRRFIQDAEKFIYKYDSVIDMLDADGKSMLLIVGGDNIGYDFKGKKQIMFNGGAKRRAKHNDIYIYHEKTLDEERFISEVKRFFELER
jgi:hypothetical protein